MDSRMLEVAIGLALVFALFGLLVTAVHEGLAQWMKSRGKTLRLAVESLLGDDKEMARALMAHPLVVSMAEGAASPSQKPSYLSADVFVSALISHVTTDLLRNDAKPATPGEFVTRLAAAGLKGSDNLARSLQALLPGAETDWPAFEQRLCAWYEAVNERATGWYKRRAQRDMLLIGTVAAMLLNINPIVIGPRLWDDDVLRQSLVSAGEQASQAHTDALAKGTPGDPALAAAGSAAAVRVLQAKARSPATGSTQLMATQESEAVEKLLLEVNQRLAAVAPASGKAADHTTAPLLKAMDGMTRLVKALDESRAGNDGTLLSQRRLLQSAQNLTTEVAALRGLAASPAARPLGGDLPAKVEEFDKAVKAELDARKKTPDETPPTECSKAQTPQARMVCERLGDMNALHIAGLPIGWDPLYLPTIDQEHKCRRAAWTATRLKQAVQDAKENDKDSPASSCAGVNLLGNPNLWFALFGWLLTGLAGTLGATFWFDLLTRFVKLRGAGGKQGEAGAAATGNAAGTAATAPAPGGPGGVLSRPVAAAPPPRPSVPSDVLNLAEAALTTAEVEEVQRRLTVMTSGYFNQATRDAIAVWQRGRQEAETGELTAAQIIDLLGRPPSGEGEGFVG